MAVGRAGLAERQPRDALLTIVDAHQSSTHQKQSLKNPSKALDEPPKQGICKHFQPLISLHLLTLLSLFGH